MEGMEVMAEDMEVMEEALEEGTMEAMEAIAEATIIIDNLAKSVSSKKKQYFDRKINFSS